MTIEQPLSRFKVLGQLGRGGTAEVARVWDADLKIQAALKTPLPENVIDFAKLVRREKALIGGYRFPGLVRLLDSPGDQHLLLELCPGPTLDRIGRVEQVLLACNLLSALALDLEFLRACGIVHGDLKLQNFFLPEDWNASGANFHGYIKLSDFSLGRKDSEPDSLRAGLGTVGYMAPETIKDGRVSHRSDLFALGVIAYQLLSGNHPFLQDDPEPVRVNARTIEETPPPLNSIRPDLPERLMQLVSDLLAKDELQRPDTAWQVCQELRQCGASYPFEKRLLPKHLLRRDRSFKEMLSDALAIDEENTTHLSLLSDLDPKRLRLLLDANWRAGALAYDDRRFVFKADAIWPSRLRRDAFKEFTLASPRTRKSAIRSAVTESSWTESHKLSMGFHRRERLSAPLSQLLLPLLRVSTIKRLAAAQAPVLERDDQHENASYLYVMSGDLPGAERCAYQAACQLRKEHRLQQALSLCQTVIRLADLRRDLFTVRALIMLKGDILKEMGESSQAQTTYEQLVTLYDGHLPDSLLGEAYKDLGDLFKMKQDFDAGIKSLERAMQIFEQIGDRLEVSHVLNNMGNMFWVASDLLRAQKHYRQALGIQKRLKAQHDIASTLSNIGTIMAVRGRFARSIRLFRLSLALKEEIGNLTEIARTLNNLGYVSLLAGQLSQSVDYLRESLDRNRRTGNKHEVLINLGNLAQVTHMAGRLKQAQRFIDEGLALASELGDKPHTATFKMIQGDLRGRMGRFFEAEESFAEAARLFGELDDRHMSIEYKLRYATLKDQVGDSATALRMGHEGYQEAQAAGDRNLQLMALLVLTKHDSDQGMVETALALARELHLIREETHLQFNRVEQAINGNMPKSVASEIEKITAACHASDDNIDLPHMYNLAAEWHLSLGHIDQASQLVEKAIRFARSMELDPELAAALNLKGQLESRRGAYESAYALCRQALQIVKQIAENISSDSDRDFYMQKRSVQFLISEIRRLGSQLGQKQRAGSNPALIQS